MEQNPLFGKVPGNVPVGGCGLSIHLKHQPDICRFVWIYHQLFCIDAVHLNRLCMEAVRGFPTHLETSLAARIVSVRYSLLYGFPLKLANTIQIFNIARPIGVEVSNFSVEDTNSTLYCWNSSIMLAKSRMERLIRSSL